MINDSFLPTHVLCLQHDLLCETPGLAQLAGRPAVNFIHCVY